LLLVVFIFAGACFYLLSPWQFRRNAERTQQNSAITSSLRDAPATLDHLLPDNAAPTTAQQWHPVTFTGTYLADKETIARLRQISDQPAYEVLTPFKLTSGTIVLIDRGWLAPTDGTVPTYAPPPTGQVTIVARVQLNETDPKNRAPIVENGKTEVYAISSIISGTVTGLTIRPGYFQLTDNQPGILQVIPLPMTDSGPFLSYALQWIVFGAMAIFGLGYFTWRELKPGGALTSEGRAERRAVRAGEPAAAPRSRRDVAAMIADEEEAEHAEYVRQAGHAK
jgi:cytochrome oxidase assembly protein ShyY1